MELVPHFRAIIDLHTSLCERSGKQINTGITIQPPPTEADNHTCSLVFVDDDGTLDLGLIFLQLQLLLQLSDGLNCDLPQLSVLVLFFDNHVI